MVSILRRPIGILGDGQLALFLALAARRWGIPVISISLNPEQSPLKGIAQLIACRNWNDEQGIKPIFRKCQKIFLENEFIAASVIERLIEPHSELFPNLKSYQAIDSKWKQKTIARDCGVAVPPYHLVEASPHDENLPNLEGTEKFEGQEVFIKFVRGGYDGKGNQKVRWSPSIAQELYQRGGAFLIEPILCLDAEWALLALREKNGEIIFWEACDTVQNQFVCEKVIVPSSLSQEIIQVGKKAAERILNQIEAIGLFAFEFFVSQGQVLLNEISPRPHNTGHWTMEGSTISQYEALLQLGLGLPIAKPVLNFPAVGMLNLFGTKDGEALFSGERIFFYPPSLGGKLHFYGKSQSRKGRKMGHWTIWDTSSQKVAETLEMAKTRYILGG